MSTTADVDIPGEGKIPTMIEWKYDAVSVHVWGDWDDVFRPLNRYGQTHWILLHLRPGKYHVHFFVDGQYLLNPEMLYEHSDEGYQATNILFVHSPEAVVAATVPDLKPYGVQSHESKVPVPIIYHCALEDQEHVYVEGSWDWWKERVPLMRVNNDHFLLLNLHPGKYPFKYIVKGERKLNKDIPVGNGLYEGTNVLHVEADPISVMPQGISYMVLDEFLEVHSDEIVELFKFNVGMLFGDIGPEIEMYPCTSIGYMLINGFVNYAKSKYLKKKSWAGTFQPKDMIIIDGRYCFITKEPMYELTRVNLLLDNYQMRKSLFERFERNGKYPPYFPQMFAYHVQIPLDFDANTAARNEYLDCLSKVAALARSSQRMHLLVNVAQFFKQLSEKEKTDVALLFFSILQSYPDWQHTVCRDALMEAVFMNRRKEGVGSKVVMNQATITGLELPYFLRVFFVHVPEHTLKSLLEPFKLVRDKDGKRPIRRRADQIKDTDIQYLKSHVEADLIACHYFEECLSTLVFLVRRFKTFYPLLQAAWDSYTETDPPFHL